MRLPALCVAVVLVAGGCGTAGPVGSVALPVASPEPSSRAKTAGPTVDTTAGPIDLFGSLPDHPFDAATAIALQGVLDRAVSHGAPDAIAAVITPDGAWSGAAGIGGPDGRAATPDDVFYMASLTQVFTAALVMKLAEEDRIDVDAALATYLDGMDVDTNGATVRHALGMRSGLADSSDAAAAAIRADAGRVWTPAETLEYLAPPTADAGSKYVPAGLNYTLLALAAEHVTGTSFAAALRTEVLDPVGASGILQQGAGVPTPKPWALPTEAHLGAFSLDEYGSGDVISCISSVSFSFGYGSMAGDAGSIAAWAWHLFAGEVVSEASLRQMLPAIPDLHGFGLHVLGDLGPRYTLGITGQKTGYGSILAVTPAEKSVVVFLVNDPEFIFEPFVIQLIETSRAG